MFHFIFRFGRNLACILMLLLPFFLGCKGSENKETLPPSTITLLPVPGDVQPEEIIQGPDGNLWFTVRASGRLGKISPNGVTTMFLIEPGNSPLGGLAAGPDGNVWFTLSASGRLGKISPNGIVTLFDLPEAQSQPAGIASGPDGNLWFTMRASGRLGKISPNGVVSLYNLPDANSQPQSIAAGPDGNLWFTLSASGRLGKISPTGHVTLYSVAEATSQPMGLTQGPDGNMWFTLRASGRLGKISPNGVVTLYNLSDSKSEPQCVASGPDGNLWFTLRASGRLGKISPNGVITILAPVANDPEMFGITRGPDGCMYCTLPTRNTIVRAQVVEGNGVSVSLQPQIVTLPPEAEQLFTASVSGSSNTSVRWSISEGSSGGSINEMGLYRAPTSPGTFHVVATSQADPSKTATATVTVSLAPTISSFRANPATITVGESSELLGEFSHGTALIQPGNLPILSGVPFKVTPAETTEYTLEVVNSLGWSESRKLSVTVLPEPSIAAFTAQPALISLGDSTELHAEFSGGEGRIEPGIGAIKSGQILSLSPRETTTFTLTVTSPTGKTLSQSRLVTVVPLPVIGGFTLSPSLIQQGDMVELLAQFDGGAGVVTPSVGPVTSGQRIQLHPNQSTTYTLTVINPAGKQVSQTATVQVLDAPSISSFSAQPNQLNLGESTQIQASFTGGQGRIEPEIGEIQSGQVFTIKPNQTTTYTLRVTNSLGRAVSSQVTVTVVPLPLIQSFTSHPEAITQGEACSLLPVFTEGTGQIEPGIGLVQSGQSVVVKPSQSTVYTLTVTNSLGRSIQSHLNLRVVPPPVIQEFTANPTSLTIGDKVQLRAIFSGGLGKIEPGVGSIQSGQTVDVFPVSDTSYTLTVVNELGFQVTAQVLTVVWSKPTIELFEADPSILTLGDRARLKAEFSKGEGRIEPGVGPITSGQIIEVQPQVTTTYTLIVRNVPGAQTQAQTTIRIVSPPTIQSFSATPSIISEGDTTRLMAVFSGGQGFIEGMGEVQSGQSLEIRPTKTQNYVLKVINEAGRATSTQLTITVVPLPTIQIWRTQPEVITQGQGAELQADFLNGSGHVDQGIGSITSGQRIPIHPDQTSTFTLTVTNLAGKRVEARATLQVLPPPTISSFTATPALITQGEVAQLKAVFSNGSGVIEPGGISITSGVAITVAPSITTTYTLTVTNPAGTNTTQTTIVEVVPPPVITSFTATPSMITAGASSLLKAVFTGGTGVIDQGIGAVTSGINQTTGSLFTSTTYTLRVTNPAGTSVTQSVLVTVVGAPTITSFTATPNSITAGQSTTLSATFAGGSGVVQPGNLPLASGGTLSVSPPSTTVYTLTVTNPLSVSVQQSATVTVAPMPVIHSFTATPTTVAMGASATLFPVFDAGPGGSGEINQGIGTVNSGVGILTPPLTTSTSFILSVRNVLGFTLTQSVLVTVAGTVPTITSFTASPSSIAAGNNSQLTAIFSGGTGIIHPGSIPVTSGIPVSVSPASTTLYTLTVSDGFNPNATATTTVTVTTLSGTWTQVTADGGFTGRLHPSSAVLGTEMWMFGGFIGAGTAGTYKSSNGSTWSLVTSTPTFGRRWDFGMQYFNGKWWVMGGYPTTSSHNIWSSTDGVAWTSENPTPPWSEREAFGLAVMDGKLWMFGGIATGTVTSDAWKSYDGITWLWVTPSDPRVANRYAFDLIEFQGKLWALAGHDGTQFLDDIWSSTDGFAWTLEKAHAEFGPRASYSLVVFDNKLWIIGGNSPGDVPLNDTWYSENGITWIRLNALPTFAPARVGASAVVFNNQIWLIGGSSDAVGSSRLPDVWRLNILP